MFFSIFCNRFRPLTLILLIALIFLSQLSSLNATTVQALNDGMALTPPMGWNSWNKYGCGISDNLIRAQADAMVSSGMAAVGYKYVNLDDCWSQKTRDANGNLVPDPIKFPNGMKVLADYVHSKGLKLGIYADRGTQTCSGYPGSQGHEVQDANTWASWGIDYVKYDNCNASLDAQTQYTAMRDALRATGRPIIYSLCHWQFFPWDPSVGHLSRTSGDIADNFSSILSVFDTNAGSASVAGPGYWNDPDMLEVGNGGMTTSEDQAHFSLWAISAAPLIAGNDLTTMSAETQNILTNAEVIAVDQDALGVQGTKVREVTPGLQVWAKRLGGAGQWAVVLLNRTGGAANITVNWSDLGITGSASVRDLWAHVDRGSFPTGYTASVPSHGVVMTKVSAVGGSTPVPPSPTNPPLPTNTPGGPTNTPTRTPTYTFTPTITNTPASGLSVELKSNGTDNNQQTGFSYRVRNTGASALSSISVRIYFTTDGSNAGSGYALEKFYDQSGVATISAPTLASGSTYYFNINYGTASLAAGGSWEFQTALHLTSWGSTYSGTNDWFHTGYAADALPAAYTSSTYIPGYLNSTRVWGNEPGGSVITNTPVIPTTAPTTAIPTRVPTTVPTTVVPTRIPTTPVPDITPSRIPTQVPTTAVPTRVPTTVPTTAVPTRVPTTPVPDITPSRIPTQVPTTAVPTRVPTTVPTTAVPTIVPTTGTSSLKIQYKAADTLTGDNQLKPHFRIVNSSTSPVALSELKIRYYFTKDNTAGLTFNCDWAQVGCTNLSATFVAATGTDTDTYIEISFAAGAGSVAANSSTGDIQARINHSDWTNFNESNDYSFDATKTAFADWNRVVLLRNGIVVWGTTP